MASRKPPTGPPPSDPSDPLFTDENTTKAAPREPGDDQDELLPQKQLAKRPDVESAPGVFVGTERAITTKTNALGMEAAATRESAAVATQIATTVQARIVQAINRPRSIEDVRTRILLDCKRPAFAKAALYSLPPRGDGKRIEGLSIRFAEAAIRHMTNIATETITLYEDSEKRIVRVSVVDLESNTSHSRDITLLKTVERKFLKEGQEPLGKRMNSSGQPVFIVEATDEEVLTKEANQRSKILRNEGLRLVPADILDEAKAQCRLAAKLDDASDPATAWKKLADGYVELGIKPADLSEYLGCDLAGASPAQIEELRLWYISIREGDTTWSSVLSAKIAELRGSDDEEEQATSTSKFAKIKADAIAKAAARKAEKEAKKS